VEDRAAERNENIGIGIVAAKRFSASYQRIISASSKAASRYLRKAAKMNGEMAKMA